MIDLKVRWIGVDELRHDLKLFNAKAIPYAARNGLNKGAFEARRIWQGEIKRAFVLRNQYTVNSVRVDTAKGLDTRRMEAVVGSVAPYMRTQEEGGTVSGKSGKKAIPGPVAAGQPPGAKRTQMVRAGLRMSRLRVQRIRATNKRQFNAIAIAMAKRRGSKVAVLQRARGGKGVFAIRGTKRAPTTALLYDVSKGSVRVGSTPTLGRTINRMNARFPRIMADSFLAELKRHGIGY
jgi:hypothetical protein